VFDLDFTGFNYYPTLRTRVAELKGLENLDTRRKRRIVPLVTLGRWPKATEFTRAAEKASLAMDGLPWLIDLTTDASHLGEQQLLLRDPSGGFQAWRDFVGRQVGAVPVAQIVAKAPVREVVRQAGLLEASAGRLAFRIRDFELDTPYVIAALSALDDTSNAIVFIDCGYIRNAFIDYVSAARATLAWLRTEFPTLAVCVLSTSFPSSTIPFSEGTQQRGTIDIQERSLHQHLGGGAEAIYGDHASVHSVIYDASIRGRWAARVDLAREIDWAFERRPNDQSAEGYVSAARSILQSYPDIAESEIWGERMIVQAAGGEPHGKAPSSWIAVRVNTHLARQIDFADAIDGDLEDDSDEL
jgi:hypothetical protein